MLLYPEVQRKAQEELDCVVGRGRMPDFSDEDNLPYVRAICAELTRWRTVAPLGVPHALIVADDEYRGMFIPKGTTVIANIWYAHSKQVRAILIKVDRAILRDEKLFGPENVDDFIPERFMKSNAKFPDQIFGFGRRCAFQARPS